VRFELKTNFNQRNYRLPRSPLESTASLIGQPFFPYRNAVYQKAIEKAPNKNLSNRKRLQQHENLKKTDINLPLISARPKRGIILPKQPTPLRVVTYVQRYGPSAQQFRRR
jgi:hypothetical protein